MWSILTDPLPEYISVNGVIFGVRTDFRIWLRVSQMISELDNRQADNTFLTELFNLVVSDDARPDGYMLGADFIEAVMKFYDGPKPRKEEETEGKPKTPRPARRYDFGYDAEFIYQSFASFYHIRLVGTEMHWWEFAALFEGLLLNDGNSFSFVTSVRQRNISDVPKQQRAAYGKMKKELALPKSEKLAEAENAVYKKLQNMWNAE